MTPKNFIEKAAAIIRSGFFFFGGRLRARWAAQAHKPQAIIQLTRAKKTDYSYLQKASWRINSDFSYFTPIFQIPMPLSFCISPLASKPIPNAQTGAVTDNAHAVTHRGRIMRAGQPTTAGKKIKQRGARRPDFRRLAQVGCHKHNATLLAEKCLSQIKPELRSFLPADKLKAFAKEYRQFFAKGYLALRQAVQEKRYTAGAAYFMAHELAQELALININGSTRNTSSESMQRIQNAIWEGLLIAPHALPPNIWRAQLTDNEKCNLQKLLGMRHCEFFAEQIAIGKRQSFLSHCKSDQSTLIKKYGANYDRLRGTLRNEVLKLSNFQKEFGSHSKAARFWLADRMATNHIKTKESFPAPYVQVLKAETSGAEQALEASLFISKTFRDAMLSALFHPEVQAPALTPAR